MNRFLWYTVPIFLTIGCPFAGFGQPRVQCGDALSMDQLLEPAGSARSSLTVIGSAPIPEVQRAMPVEEIQNPGFAFGNHFRINGAKPAKWEDNPIHVVDASYTDDKYHYIAARGDGLNVVDKKTGEIVFRQQFTENASYGHSITADAKAITADDKYIYIATLKGGVHIFDKATFTEVKVLTPHNFHGISSSVQNGGSLDLSELSEAPQVLQVEHIAVQKNLVYIAGPRIQLTETGNHAPVIMVMDINTEKTVQIIALPSSLWLTYSTGILGVAVDGDKLYLSYSFAGILEYDMKERTFTPFERQAALALNGLVVKIPETPGGIRLRGPYLYVTDDYLGIAVFNRQTKRLIKYIQTADGTKKLWAREIDIDPENPNLLYASNAGGGLVRLDLSQGKDGGKVAADFFAQASVQTTGNSNKKNASSPALSDSRGENVGIFKKFLSFFSQGSGQ